jgi:hypothetical protein
MRAAFSLFIALLAIPGLAYAGESAVILASDNPADFAVAGALGEKLGLDVITTPWGTLGDESVQQIRASRRAKAYVVGGAAAVPEAEDTLAQYDISVERIGGGDRYETAALVAGKWDKSARVFIADGFDTQGIGDAAERARAADAPIVFVRRENVHQTVADAIAGLNATEAVLVPAPDMDTQSIEASIRATGVTMIETVETDLEERARSAVEEAAAAVSGAGANASEEITDAESVAAFRLLERAREHLNYARGALDAERYGEAFGQAVASRENAENSARVSSGVVVGHLRTYVDGARAEIEALVKLKIDIGEISENPVKYGGRDVQVTGIVLSDPIYIGEKTYIEMRDATGTIVVQKGGFMGPPLVKKDDTITVTGSVSINPSFGVPQGGVHSGMPTYVIEAAEIEHVY